MLLTILAMAIQVAGPAGDPEIVIPDSALRDPYGFVLSHCSPLVRRSSETLEACEHRVGTALQARLPSFQPRPPTTMVASAADDPASATESSTFGGRCTTRQDSQTSEDGSSSSSSSIVCGDRSGPAAAVLESLLRPQ